MLPTEQEHDTRRNLHNGMYDFPKGHMYWVVWGSELDPRSKKNHTTTPLRRRKSCSYSPISQEYV